MFIKCGDRRIPIKDIKNYEASCDDSNMICISYMNHMESSTYMWKFESKEEVKKMMNLLDNILECKDMKNISIDSNDWIDAARYACETRLNTPISDDRIFEGMKSIGSRPYLEASSQLEEVDNFYVSQINIKEPKVGEKFDNLRSQIEELGKEIIALQIKRVNLQYEYLEEPFGDMLKDTILTSNSIPPQYKI